MLRSALYTTIHEQPAAVRSLLDSARETCAVAAAALRGKRRIFLAGTGTSSHAAVVGEHLLRAAGAVAYATTSFDFVTYARPLGPDDALIAISHTGKTQYARKAIERARQAGAYVIGITGTNSPMTSADMIITTAAPERSDTYTASYTTTLVALAMIATDAGLQQGGNRTAMQAALAHLPEDIGAVLGCEAVLQPLAAELAHRGRITLVGAGPNAVTAREGALKLKESAFITAEGFELETVLHGGLQAIEGDDTVVVVAADGPAIERMCDLVRALDLIGARILLIADQRVAGTVAGMLRPEAHTTMIAFPSVPETLSPILAVVPLQLLAAATSEARGTNPDNFRFDDLPYEQAVKSYTL